jgi:murein DD-endopeptidase MepM/ murein hydrolase activator NlpD
VKKVSLLCGVLALVASATLYTPPVAAHPDDEQHSWSCRFSSTAPNPVAVADLRPFLKLPFRQEDGQHSLSITNGWQMAEDEIPFAGPGLHSALDFEFLRTHDHGYNVPVLAAADGRAYYTYQYISGDYTDPQGEQHQIGLGAGLVIEVRHCNGFVTQYIHVNRVADGIPYLKPEPDTATPGDWVPSGLFKTNQELWQTGTPVRAGQIIGWQGDTGIGFDWKDNFKSGLGIVIPRDRQKLPPWDPTQLHFQVYGGRVDGAKQNIVDPSDIYGQITHSTNPYTKRPGDLLVGPKSLWLSDRRGLLYADE